MAKKIRHLEFYGYPDQNVFTGFGNMTPINLDDIREKNKEQDEELNNLDDEKVDKSEFNQLSGVVDTFVGLQTQFNDVILNKVNQHESAITAIHDWIDSVADDISDIDEVAEKANEILSGLSELEITVSGISCALDDKADKDYVDSNFAKKDDVYTKDEVDAMIASSSGCCESCVTESWLDENGYLTEEEADDKYATSDELSAVSATNDEIADAVNELSGDVSSLSSYTTTKINIIETNIETLNTTTNTRINTLSGVVSTFEGRITQNAADIDNLERELAGKADRADLEALERRVQNDEEDIADRVKKSEFTAYTATVSEKFDYYDNKKADKTDISALTSNIADVVASVEAEAQARENADNELDDKIDAVNERVNVIAEANVTRDDRIDALESGLTKEIADRIQGDIDLIGTSSDSATDDTIWGAKKYAVSQRNQAITEANNHTNQEIANVQTELNNALNEIERELSEKADTDYVDAIKNEVKADLRSEIDSKVNEERVRAQREETLLNADLAELRGSVLENDEALDNLADRVNAITAWEGTNPEEYDNSGNGVLDVLHREFHEFEQTHGMIKDIKVVDGNLVITYFTEDGEAETIIPIEQLVNLEDYYTKEETEALINEAISGLTLDDYYTKEEVDTLIESAITTSSEQIEKNKTNIETLFDRLGYTDNDTIVTKNEHEVAFGSYNESHSGETPGAQTAFSIGIGTDDENRKNAVEVMKNGDVYMWVEGEFMCINTLLGQLAHETYYDDGGY